VPATATDIRSQWRDRTVDRARDVTVPLPPRLLAAIAIDHATYASSALLATADDLLPGERTFERVVQRATHDIWHITWGAGSRTEMHDHGGSTGALYVVEGTLVEHRPHPARTGRTQREVLHERSYHAMPAAHVHVVANESHRRATSIHVYSPPLTTMQHYETADRSGLHVVRREVIDPATLGPDGRPAHR